MPGDKSSMLTNFIVGYNRSRNWAEFIVAERDILCAGLFAGDNLAAEKRSIVAALFAGTAAEHKLWSTHGLLPVPADDVLKTHLMRNYYAALQELQWTGHVTVSSDGKHMKPSYSLFCHLAGRTMVLRTRLALSEAYARMEPLSVTGDAKKPKPPDGTRTIGSAGKMLTLV